MNILITLLAIGTGFYVGRELKDDYVKKLEEENNSLQSDRQWYIKEVERLHNDIKRTREYYELMLRNLQQ